MKKALVSALTFLFVLSLGACTGGKQSAVTDSPTSKTRFTVSSDGVISDPKTGLEWIIGPESYTKYSYATEWVASCKVAGGGWRMPTLQELKTLHEPGVGQNNIYPAFKNTGFVLAQSDGFSDAPTFDIGLGQERKVPLNIEKFVRVFGVRSRP